MGKNAGGMAATPTIAKDSIKSTAIVRFIDGLGEGPWEMWSDPLHPEKDILLDGTPIMNADGSYNFTGIRVDWRAGYIDQTHIPGFPVDSADISSAVGLPKPLKQTQAVNFTIPPGDYDAIILRQSVGGLVQRTQQGESKGTEIFTEIYGKDATAGRDYHILAHKFLKDKATSKYEWSTEIKLADIGPVGPWSIQVRRITPDSDSELLVNDTAVEGVTVVGYRKFAWPGLVYVAVEADATQFPNIPTRSYRLKGNLVQIPANYDPVTRTYATSGPGTDNGVWDGSFKLGFTKNPAWHYYFLLTSEQCGLGDYIKPHMVDKWELYQIARYNDELVPSGRRDAEGNDILEPRFELSIYLQTQESALQTLQAVASSFRAMTYWASGAVFAAQDRPQDPSYLFNQTNVEGGVFRYSTQPDEGKHNFAIVRWNDPTINCRPAYEPILYEKGIQRDNGQLRVVDITAFGTQRLGQAIRQGKWTLETDNTGGNGVEFVTGMAGLQLRPGDVFAVADPRRRGYGLSGRVEAFTPGIVTLDREATITDSPTYLIATNSDGLVSEHRVTNSAGPTREIFIEDLAATFNPGATWVLSTKSDAPTLWRTYTVKKDDRPGKYNVVGLSYDPSKYDRVERGLYIPPLDTVLGGGGTVKDEPLRPPQGIVIEEYLYKDREDLKTGVNIRWTPGSTIAVKHVVAYQVDSGTWVELAPTAMNTADVRPVEAPCEFRVKIHSTTVKGNPTSATEQVKKLLGKTAPPQNVSGFTVKLEDSVLVFSWNHVTDIDLSCYEIREGADWDTGAVVASGILGNKFISEIGASRNGLFWIKAKDTSGNYSTTPASASADILSALDGDVLAPAQKKLLTQQWSVILAEQQRLGALAAAAQVDIAAYNTAIAAFPTFFATRYTPKAWNDLTGPTYLGVGGGGQLNLILKNIATEYEDVKNRLATALLMSSIASGATDAMLKSGFVDQVSGKIKWSMIKLAAQEIYAHQITIANFDNLIPNPMSELPPPASGWPAGAVEAAGLLYDTAWASTGIGCRTASPGELIAISGKIPCGPGDQFCFRAKVRGIGAKISIRFNGSGAGSHMSEATCTTDIYSTVECTTTAGAPAGVSFVQFFIEGRPSAGAAYFDELYARRMNDGLLTVDGSVKAQHLAAVLAILGEIKNPGYVAGTAATRPTGFRIHGSGFEAVEFASGRRLQVSAEFGRAVSLAGHFLGDSMDRLWNAMNRVVGGVIANRGELWADGTRTGHEPRFGLWNVTAPQSAWRLQDWDSSFRMFPAVFNPLASIAGLAMKGGGYYDYTRVFAEQSFTLPVPVPGGGAIFSAKFGGVRFTDTSGVTYSGQFRLIAPDGVTIWESTPQTYWSPDAQTDGSTPFEGTTWTTLTADAGDFIRTHGAGDYRVAFICKIDVSSAAPGFRAMGTMKDFKLIV